MGGRAGLVLCLAMALGLVPVVGAQSTLSRSFERVFFVRAECWLDECFGLASKERRKKALPLVQQALALRGWANSQAGGRCRLLARACAVLQGLEPNDVRFHDRFNFFLMALPEVVDPKKIERDRKLLGDVTRQIYPLLPEVKVADPTVASTDRDKIFLTVRGVFGADKPPALRARLGMRPDGGNPAQLERGDSNDPQGWLMFDLMGSFAVDAVGRYRASAEIGVAETWPRAGDPPCSSRFWVEPGYHQRFWRLLDLRKQLGEKQQGPKPRAVDLDRLTVVTEEALRVLLGRDFLVRSWPTRALAEATELAETLVAGKRPAVSARGDRVYGIKVANGRTLPLRVVWGAHGEKTKGVLVLPPGGHDENQVVDGLKIPVADLQASGRVWAFTTFPTTGDYLRKAQLLMRSEFGVTSARTTLVGVLDGSTRASYALGLLETPLAEMVLIGHEAPSGELLRDKDVARLRVIRAYGSPDSDALSGLARRAKRFNLAKGRLRIESGPPRSLREAFRLLLD
ncbi:MAG: hypothetical protein CMJ85_11340 [Planctomycetes bacterium]|nr:hypothetical protein [Planctomycetota bacterium]